MKPFHILVRHLPMWLPGAGFKRKAIQWRAKMEEFVDKPYEIVQERMVSPYVLVYLDRMIELCAQQRNGTAVPCFVTTLLEDIRDEKGTFDPQRDYDIRWTANSMFSASMDTVST